MKGYYFITDAELTRQGIIRDAQCAIAAGARIIQYRNKSGRTREMIAEARKLKQVCVNSLFLINDRVDVALAVGAGGVHIGRDDMPYALARKLLGKKRVVGVSVSTLKQAKQAEKNGADYLGVGPIFPTGTKKDAGKALGTELLAHIKRHVSIPVVAIGGITLENAGEVVLAGADALCAISAVLKRKNVRSAVAEFQKFF